jgi:hypothetical protein
VDVVDVVSGRGVGLRPGRFDFFSGLLAGALSLRALLCLGGSFCTGVGLALAAAAAFMVTVIDSVPVSL